MLLEPTQWADRMAEHEERAAQRLARYRRPPHPVFDFLFTYYPVRPSHLMRWHPGFGVELAGAPPHAQWRFYTTSGGRTTVDAAAMWAQRAGTLDYLRGLLARTQDNPTTFDCFGLHEWAMVYRTSPRHDLPLRLGVEGTNEVVEAHRIKCTHYDAFRFFSEPARPLNLTVLRREDQPDYDQAGCVHATMDLYKWCWKAGPLVPGELFLEAFDLAVRARVLDMEASPYDCRGLGFGVVPIETPEGKAEYVRRQRDLAADGRVVRDRLVSLVESAAAATLMS